MFRALLLLIIAFSSLAANAADFKFGFAADYGVVALDDPEGDGKQTGIFYGAALTGNYPLKWRDTSLVSGIGYMAGSSDASETDVGQDLAGYYVFSRFQTRSPLSRALPNLYSYIGAKFIGTTHKKRHTVYQGYIKEEFSNRDNSAFNLGVGLGYKFEHKGGRQSIPSFYFDAPITGKMLLVGLQYQFEF